MTQSLSSSPNSLPIWVNYFTQFILNWNPGISGFLCYQQILPFIPWQRWFRRTRGHCETFSILTTIFCMVYRYSMHWTLGALRLQRSVWIRKVLDKKRQSHSRLSRPSAKAFSRNPG
jgi:hypothetical protein